MTNKKTRISTAKKNQTKKKTVVKSTKPKTEEKKQTIRKKLNEFGDSDSL
jgi:hypothetical protein